jgi:hypothetical protein
MTKLAPFAALTVAAIALPSLSRADTSPLVNRVIVQQALQQQMQTQLNTQAVQLQTQQDVTRAAIQGDLQQQILQLQYLELQQQLNLMKLQVHARALHSSKKHRPK